MKIIQYIGESVKERRKSLGLDQRTVAELSQVGVNSIYRLERGESNTSLKVVEKVMETLGLELKIEIRNSSL